MQLSKKLKIFCEFPNVFPKSKFNLKHFEKIDESHRLCLSEITDFEIRAYVNV